jgi:uncharacterized protein (DUF779 family)
MLRDELNKIKTELSATREQSERALALGTELSTGTVVIFDRSSGCPDGWTPFQPAMGRFVVGVGSGNKDVRGDSLTNRDFLSDGGEEQVRLTKEQMPRHRHGMVGELPSREFITGKTRERVPTSISTSAGEVWFEGANKPHNNMPPYIALHFCKKV